MISAGFTKERMLYYNDIDELSDEHVRQLHQLYQQEWWTEGRSLEDVRASQT